MVRSARSWAPLSHLGARMGAMPSYIAFLRAVNVGGRFVKMDSLREALGEAGFSDVQTHIQSGNVFVRSARRTPGPVAVEITRVLTAHCGFDVPAIVRTPAQVRSVLASVDAVEPLLAGESRRYVAFADADIPSRRPRSSAQDQTRRAGSRARLGGPRRDDDGLPQDHAHQHPPGAPGPGGSPPGATWASSAPSTRNAGA